jgi:hypothetical protein
MQFCTVRQGRSRNLVQSDHATSVRGGCKHSLETHRERGFEASGFTEAILSAQSRLWYCHGTRAAGRSCESDCSGVPSRTSCVNANRIRHPLNASPRAFALARAREIVSIPIARSPRQQNSPHSHSSLDTVVCGVAKSDNIS